jgi:tetratricopeptide (TPR) repeat protein
MEIGRRAYAAGDWAEARRAFEAVSALEPGHEEALGYLSYIEIAERPQLERPTPSPPPRVPIRRAPPPEQLLAEGHFRKGQEAERNGRNFRALEEYQRALSDASGHEGARSALERLRRELSPRVPTLYESGKRYFQDDDLHNALKNWNQVLLIQPDHTQAAENAVERLEEIQGGS